MVSEWLMQSVVVGDWNELNSRGAARVRSLLGASKEANSEPDSDLEETEDNVAVDDLAAFGWTIGAFLLRS